MASLLGKFGENKCNAKAQLLFFFPALTAQREWDFSSAPRVMPPMRRDPARPRPGVKGYLTLGFSIRGAPSVDKGIVLIYLYQ